MGVAELRLKLHETIDSIDDGNKLEALYTLLKDTKSTFSPMTLKDYTDAIDEAKLQIKNGKSSSIEDLEKESENW